jgi:dTDP-4-amino-4,6-dideoxygalactose transaminase
LVCFSFYANKNLSAADGGAIALADGSVAENLRSLRQNGLPIDAWKRFTHSKSLLLSNSLTQLGYKMNFTDLQASIARVQLRRQPEFSRRRLEIAKCYRRRLKAASHQLSFQTDIVNQSHARHLFVVYLSTGVPHLTRNSLLLSLRFRKIGATIHYAPLHKMPLYRQRTTRLPLTERICQQIVTLPISASMTIEDANYVCDHLLALLTESKRKPLNV